MAASRTIEIADASDEAAGDWMSPRCRSVRRAVRGFAAVLLKELSSSHTLPVWWPDSRQRLQNDLPYVLVLMPAILALEPFALALR